MTFEGDASRSSFMKAHTVEESVSIAQAFDPEPVAYANGSPLHQAASAVDWEHERIAVRAYERFLARGEQHGDDLRDWLDAEREIRGSRP